MLNTFSKYYMHFENGKLSLAKLASFYNRMENMERSRHYTASHTSS